MNTLIIGLIVVVAILVLLYKRGIIKLPVLNKGTNVPTEATNVAPSDTPVTIPGTNQQISGVMDAILRSGAGYGKDGQGYGQPNAGGSGPSVFDDGIVRYNHHTYAHGVTSTLVTEPLQGKTRVSFTYCAQEAGKQGPTQIWLSENGGPEQGPMQAGVEASFLLQSTGKATLSYRSDTNGRTIAQLFRV